MKALRTASSAPASLIDQATINSFVNAVETKKGFERNPDKVFRHIVSELGELDAHMHKVDQIRKVNADGLMNLEKVESLLSGKIGAELVDIVFLCCYMAELYGADLNRLAPARMDAIATQYGVEWPEKRRGK